VELYVVGPGDDLQDRTRAVVARAAGDDLVPYLYAHNGEGAVLHLFRVAASLDSMILGEPQILGQVKTPFEQAQRLGAAPRRDDPRLRGRLRERQAGSGPRPTSAARHVDGLCRGGEGPATSSTVSTGKTVLLVGAGEMPSCPASTSSRPARPGGSW
jgi:glutamyl-tRNA reductase